MNARTLAPGELSRVEPLVQAYPFKSYRNYRVWPRKAQAAVLLAEIAGTLDDKDGVLCWQQDGDGEAVAVARVLEWDSGFFGVPMGRIEYVITSDRRLVASAVAHAVETLRARGVRHISARVDVADVASMAVFEASGFRVMDALVTYITRPRKEPPNEVREVGAIRAFRPDDGTALVEIAAEAYRGFRGRFHLDPHIPDDRADALYREWAEQCVGARMADMVLVSEGAEGRLLGFLAFRRREPVSSVGGVAVFGGGLGACRAEAPGAYAGLIRAGTIWAHERDGVAECQTQNYNFPVIRIYEAVGAHYVRAEYTLHRWIE